MCMFLWLFDWDLVFWRDVGIWYVGFLVFKLGDDFDVWMVELFVVGIWVSMLIIGQFDLVVFEIWDEICVSYCFVIDFMVCYGGYLIYFMLGCMMGVVWCEDVEWFVEVIGFIVVYGWEWGVIVVIELLLRISVFFVNMLCDVIDVVEVMGIGFVVDFGNMWMECDFCEMVVCVLLYFVFMQICDVIIGLLGCFVFGGCV